MIPREHEHQPWHEARGLLDAIFENFDNLPAELSPQVRMQYLPGAPLKTFRELTIPEDEPEAYLRVSESAWVFQENGFRNGIMNPAFHLPSHYIERYVLLGEEPSMYTSRPVRERKYLERYKFSADYDRAINYLPNGTSPNLDQLLRALRNAMLAPQNE